MLCQIVCGMGAWNWVRMCRRTGGLLISNRVSVSCLTCVIACCVSCLTCIKLTGLRCASSLIRSNFVNHFIESLAWKLLLGWCYGLVREGLFMKLDDNQNFVDCPWYWSKCIDKVQSGAIWWPSQYNFKSVDMATFCYRSVVLSPLFLYPLHPGCSQAQSACM